MNTKGQTWEELVKWIAALAGFVALVFVVIYFFKPVVLEAQTREACEQSVTLKAQTKILGKTANIPLKCKTSVIKVEDEKQLKDSYEKVADSIVDCWNQFGKGEVDFLNDFDFFTSDTYCFVCTQVQFSKEIKGNELKLGNYLKEKTLPGQETTYLQYLDRSKISSEGQINDFTDTLNSYSTDQSLYIVFSARKNFDKMAIERSFKYGLAGCLAVGLGTIYFGAGIPAGAGCLVSGIISQTVYTTFKKDTYNPSLFIGNSDKIIETCNYAL